LKRRGESAYPVQSMKRIYSWNVNGIRAAEKKGFLDWLASGGGDIVCLQETKAHPEQLSPTLTEPEGYHVYWSSASRKGYSGVAIYSKEEPLSVSRFGIPRFDDEGRVLIAEYPSFTLMTGYFPNSQAEGARLDYKLDFNNAVLEWADAQVAAGKNVVINGDYNVAHKPIDLENPKQNEKNPGYLPEEREWMDRFINSGYVDTFRMFSAEAKQYSWWSYRMQARDRNIGWRIDYHCVNKGFADRVKAAAIHQDVMGSDHCPVSIDIED
jgi:exodeoxyribonuclease-3